MRSNLFNYRLQSFMHNAPLPSFSISNAYFFFQCKHPQKNIYFTENCTYQQRFIISTNIHSTTSAKKKFLCNIKQQALLYLTQVKKILIYQNFPFLSIITMQF